MKEKEFNDKFPTLYSHEEFILVLNQSWSDAEREEMCDVINDSCLDKEKVKEVITRVCGTIKQIDPELIGKIILEGLGLKQGQGEEEAIRRQIEFESLPVHYVKKTDKETYCPICAAKQEQYILELLEVKSKGKLIPSFIIVCTNCKKKFKLMKYVEPAKKEKGERIE